MKYVFKLDSLVTTILKKVDKAWLMMERIKNGNQYKDKIRRVKYIKSTSLSVFCY